MAIPYYSMDLNFRELSSIPICPITFRAFGGEKIHDFEILVSLNLSERHVIPAPSGRTAFYFLCDALFKKGDEVIVSAFSFPLFVRILHEKGIKPVFIDVEENTGLINPDLIEQKITDKTKGLFITHLFGNACDMHRIVDLCEKRNLLLIEDCAHAFQSEYKGQPLGTFGTASIFSTSPMKTPTTLGGGFLTLKEEDLANKIRDKLMSSKEYVYSLKKLFALTAFSMIYYLNSYPWIFSIGTSRYFKHLKAKNPGALRKLFYSELISSKLFDPFERLKFSNMQASIGISQIKRHPEMIEKRRAYARIYNERFRDSEAVKPIYEHPENKNNYLYYIVRLNCDTDVFAGKAMDQGLFLFRENVWNCNDYDFAKDYRDNCPNADKLSSQLVRLPNTSFLNEDQIRHIAAIVKNLV